MRTLTDIHNELLAAKEARPELAALDSPSQFAIWRLWLYVVAVAIWTLEQLFERHKAEVEARIEQNIFGSAEWFVREMKAFQYGDNLIQDPESGRLRYATINPAKQIITHAAITVAGNTTQTAILKVAKTPDGQSNPSQLSATELNAARGYVDRLQPPGSTIIVNSLPADVVRLTLDMYYNPLFDVVQLKAQAAQAVISYFNQLPFNAEVLRSKIADSILAQVAGVKDVVIVRFEAKAAGGTFANVNRVYVPESGYLIFDPATPLVVNLKA